MRPWAKLAGFALVLASMVGLGAAVGAAVGPIDVGGDDPADSSRHGIGDEHGGR